MLRFLHYWTNQVLNKIEENCWRLKLETER